MTRGDNAVVLSSGNRGEIVYIGGTGLVYLWRDDLDSTSYAHLNPVPYDPHELEVCTCNLGGCQWPTVAAVASRLCMHDRGCPVRRHAERNPPAGCCREPA